MNITPDQTQPDQTAPDLRYAEYVLGVLSADERAQVEREIDSDPHAASTVALWERYLIPLNEDVQPVQPGAYVWARIVDALGLQGPVASTAPTVRTRSQPQTGTSDTATSGWWNSLNLWRWLGVGASIATAACLIFISQLQPPRAPVIAKAPTAHAPAATYLTAKIAQDNGVAGWTATMDLGRAQMVIVPASPAALASNRSDELWLLPPGEKPISLGVIHHDKTTAVGVPRALLAKLSDKVSLAVSVEPVGGSSTGQPTGPVIAKGQFSGV